MHEHENETGRVKLEKGVLYVDDVKVDRYNLCSPFFELGSRKYLKM